MLLMAIDVETTGLVAGRDHVIEIGYYVHDTEYEGFSKLSDGYEDSFDGECDSLLVVPLTEDWELVPDLCEGLTKELIIEHGCDPVHATRWLVDRLKWIQPDYLVAHNARFDRDFLTAMADQVKFPGFDKPWIDTMLDVKHPERLRPKLSDIQQHFGIESELSHRAEDDAKVCMDCLVAYGVDKAISNYKQRLDKVKALVWPKGKAMTRGARR